MERKTMKRANKVNESMSHGEKMQNPMAHYGCKVVNVMEEAVKDGAHVLTKMGMAPKK